MSLFKLGISSAESFEASRREYDQSEAAKAAAAQDRDARRKLCDQARDLASSKAHHTADNSSESSDLVRKYSDWATISTNTEDDSMLQAAVHATKPNKNAAPHFVNIMLRLKDSRRDICSAEETILQFNLLQDETWLYKDGKPDKISPDTAEYEETQNFLTKLGTAEFEPAESSS